MSCCSSIGQWWRFLAVWQGGLSILGAILAASLTVRLLAKKHFWLAVDILALSMPLGQAFGRLANWANQELYGKSTTLPWGIQISASHRLASVAELSSNSLFQPLFAYEAIGLIFLTSGLWWFKNHHASWQPGKGKLAMLYLTGYSWLRFSLDFLRLDRGPVWQGLGANQWVLLGVGILCLGFWVESEYKNRL